MRTVATQSRLEQGRIAIGEMTCKDYAKSSRLEWLETNGDQRQLFLWGVLPHRGIELSGKLLPH